MTLSPQGLGSDGFKEGSWVGMERPFLLGTGLGDGGVDTGPNLRDGLYGSSAQNQFMLYFNHIGAQHGLFGESGAEVCVGKVPEADRALCKLMAQALYSTVAAFLAATLGKHEGARDWLKSSQLEQLVQPAEWSTR